MREKLEKDLNLTSITNKIINTDSNLPYSTPQKLWSIPVYFVWRILRYDLGEDLSYPVIAQGMIVNHPQEIETKEILIEIESRYPQLDGINEMRRIV